MLFQQEPDDAKYGGPNSMRDSYRIVFRSDIFRGQYLVDSHIQWHIDPHSGYPSMKFTDVNSECGTLGGRVLWDMDRSFNKSLFLDRNMDEYSTSGGAYGINTTMLVKSGDGNSNEGQTRRMLLGLEDEPLQVVEVDEEKPRVSIKEIR